ncbi:MAG TPA: hypothetical protein DCL48_11290, partial [Alphaproteobacteria bacterium]|nr:hypothetical protein [Alphaproteobacteria bacterium]
MSGIVRGGRTLGGDETTSIFIKKAAVDLIKFSELPSPDGRVQSAEVSARVPAREAKRASDDAALRQLSAAEPGNLDVEALKRGIRERLSQHFQVLDPQKAKEAMSVDAAAALGEDIKASVLEEGRQAAAGYSAGRTSGHKAAGEPVLQLNPPRIDTSPPAAIGSSSGPGPAPELMTPVQHSPRALEVKTEIQETLASVSQSPQTLSASGGGFASAGADIAKAMAHDKSGSAGLKLHEDGIRAAARSQAQAQLKSAKPALDQIRSQGIAKSEVKTAALRSDIRAARERLSIALQAIYQRTRDDVDIILAQAERDVARRLDEGLGRALAAFSAQVKASNEGQPGKQASAWAEWGGVAGAALGYAWTLLRGAVQGAVAGARSTFDSELALTVKDVAEIVRSHLLTAKLRILRGQLEADAELQRAPLQIQESSERARLEIGDQFRTLTNMILLRGDAVIERLSSRYEAAQKEMAERARQYASEN